MNTRTLRTTHILAVIGISLWLLMPTSAAAGETDDLTRLNAEWQQWALSISTAVNPQLGSDDTNPDKDYSTAGKCVVGQRGPIWFLAGVFGGETATRTCSVPEGKSLFFPVANSVNINTPNICGQGPADLSVDDLRAASAAVIDGITDFSASLDGKTIQNIQRLRSQVFEVALPETNVFDAPCMAANLGNVPAGIFSPAVDDGYYTLLHRLKKGPHTLHFHAANSDQSFVQDVTYKLTVVPVSQN